MNKLSKEEFLKLFELEIALLSQEKAKLIAEKERVTDLRLQMAQALYQKVASFNWDGKLNKEEEELARELYIRHKLQVDKIIGEDKNREFVIKGSLLQNPCLFEVQELKTKLNDPTYENSQKAKIGLIVSDIDALKVVLKLPIIIRFQSANDEEIEKERKRLISELDEKKYLIFLEKSNLETEISSFESDENNLISRYIGEKSLDEKNKILSEIDGLRKRNASNLQRIIEVERSIKAVEDEIKRINGLSIAELKRELSYNIIRKFDFEHSPVAAYMSKETKHNAEESMREYELDFSRRYESMNSLYERVLNNGVNPVNYIFASVAGDEYKTTRILPLAEQYQRLLDDKRAIGDPKYGQYDFRNLFSYAFGDTVSSAAEELNITAQDTPMFWIWLGVDKEATVDQITAAIAAKVVELKEIDKKVDEKCPPLPGDDDSKFESNGVIDEAYIRQLEKYMSFEIFKDLIDKAREVATLKSSNSRLKIASTSQKISNLEKSLVSRVREIEESAEKQRRCMIMNERIGSFVQEHELKEPFERGGLLGLAQCEYISHPLPMAVLCSTSLYEKLLKEFVDKGEQIKAENSSINRDIDVFIDSALKEIEYVTGLSLEGVKGDLFPLPIDKPKEGEPLYKEKDVLRAYQTYNLELRVKRAIEKSEYIAEEEPEVQATK